MICCQITSSSAGTGPPSSPAALVLFPAVCSSSTVKFIMCFFISSSSSIGGRGKRHPLCLSSLVRSLNWLMPMRYVCRPWSASLLWISTLFRDSSQMPLRIASSSGPLYTLSCFCLYSSNIDSRSWSPTGRLSTEEISSSMHTAASIL